MTGLGALIARLFFRRANDYSLRTSFVRVSWKVSIFTHVITS
nr:MAG TPA: hypothetical protein [Myoviridae sp. ctPkE24]